VNYLPTSSYPVAEIPAAGSLEINLPQDAIISGDHLFISDTNHGRVLVWESIQDAINGEDPDTILGQEDFENKTQAIGVNRLFWPAGLAFHKNRLWVGEFKFSNRIVGFKFQGRDPVADIKANNSDGPVTIGTNDVLQVTVNSDPGSYEGDSAEWWIAVQTPFGWYYYHRDRDSWLPGISVTYQGSLIHLSQSRLLNISGLPAGTYTFYFGIDMIVNNSLDYEQLYYDSVEVDVVR